MSLDDLASHIPVALHSALNSLVGRLGPLIAHRLSSQWRDDGSKVAVESSRRAETAVDGLQDIPRVVKSRCGHLLASTKRRSDAVHYVSVF